MVVSSQLVVVLTPYAMVQVSAPPSKVVPIGVVESVSLLC